MGFFSPPRSLEGNAHALECKRMRRFPLAVLPSEGVATRGLALKHRRPHRTRNYRTDGPQRWMWAFIGHPQTRQTMALRWQTTRQERFIGLRSLFTGRPATAGNIF